MWVAAGWLAGSACRSVPAQRVYRRGAEIVETQRTAGAKCRYSRFSAGTWTATGLVPTANGQRPTANCQPFAVVRRRETPVLVDIMHLGSFATCRTTALARAMAIWDEQQLRVASSFGFDKSPKAQATDYQAP
ncbi:hypothetical protein E4U43_002082 [Claviceps pusilla]|uniref:Uncharacterized protein n=1 Tax=Claviceps pusilla TaxID=123648 RepID=A0A9P7SXS1_9HYPO|nr:hypothetical protein E4U43_002082 [Claviceps pusilla]